MLVEPDVAAVAVPVLAVPGVRSQESVQWWVGGWAIMYCDVCCVCCSSLFIHFGLRHILGSGGVRACVCVCVCVCTGFQYSETDKVAWQRGSACHQTGSVCDAKQKMFCPE